MPRGDDGLCNARPTCARTLVNSRARERAQQEGCVGKFPSCPSSSPDVTEYVRKGVCPFDTSVLEFLVCPLSKKPLRYEVKTNELINEELGIAFPIIDGIPNMIPQDARLIQKDTDIPADPTQG
ncbi:unnamed protein product [Lota lota]